jgi:hypothetical protein
MERTKGKMKNVITRHFDIVEGGVWHTTPQMLDKKYLQAYRMTFLGFHSFGTIAFVFKLIG